MGLQGREAAVAVACLVVVVVMQAGVQWRLHRSHRSQRLANDALRRQRQLLRQKLRTSLTAAAIAHEINQPISSLSLISERLILQAEEQPGPEGSLPLLQVLLAESKRVAEITEKMRMLLSSVQSEHGPVSLARVIRGALLYLHRRLQAEGVQLSSVGLEEPSEGQVHGDAEQLQVAVTNLLRNALAAVASCPPDQRRINLSLRPRPGALELTVEDSGAGFPDGWLGLDRQEERLFLSTAPGGMGLGLYVVAATADNHGGQMHLGRSLRLGGAEVRLSLPLAGTDLAGERGGAGGRKAGDWI